MKHGLGVWSHRWVRAGAQRDGGPDGVRVGNLRADVSKGIVRRGISLRPPSLFRTLTPPD